MSGADARRAAAELLVETLDRRCTLDDAFDASMAFAGLTGADRGFARAMASAALRMLGKLDAGLAPVLSRPLEDATPEARALLRAGAAQLWLMDVAPHAAVGETVAAAKSWPAAAKASGFINAVLRKVAADRSTFDALPALKVWPDWLAARLVADLGAEAAEAMAAAQSSEPALHLSVAGNPDATASAIGGDVSPHGGVYAPGGAIEALPGYEDGHWWVQDAAAALPVRLLGAQAGEHVVDLCAAPGGKTLQLAASGAQVTAVDRSKQRLNRLSDNLARTGLAEQVDMVAAKVEAWMPGRAPDRILLDAPCSALGTLRRHPEGAWIKSESSLSGYPDVQARLLRAARDMADPGTDLLYCVCTPLSREGRDVVETVLQDGGLERRPIVADEIPDFPAAITNAGDVLTLPHGEGPGHDAFFMARLVRT